MDVETGLSAQEAASRLAQNGPSELLANPRAPAWRRVLALQATGLRVQDAALTGETEAVLKDAATLPRPVALGDHQDMVFKGTAVAQGAGRAVVTATGMGTGMNTRMGKVATLLEATAQEPTPLEKEVAGVGRTLGLAVVAIAIAFVGTTLLIAEVGRRQAEQVGQTGLCDGEQYPPW